MWLTRELVASAAWRMRSVNAVRLIDFLLVEHMNHSGTENGNLMAPYDQLDKWGMSRNCIHPAIEELVFMGLIRCKKGWRRGSYTSPSTYRLTFFADKTGNIPRNEWKGRTEEHIKAWREGRTATAHKPRAKKSVHALRIVEATGSGHA
ncbi:MAG: hypothetical protein NUV50_00380 [Rhodospirillales bacterium]|nr:hypothetical protein [Rhodospirillales bacterium]